MAASKRIVLVCASAALAVGLAIPAAAQVYYKRAHADPLYAPEAPFGGYSPSYQFAPTPYGPAVRVVERCQYPDGWNVTDFGRDLNGIPAGIGHTCPEARVYGRRPN